MRIDPPGTQLRARFREPRVVIGIIYETGSIYLTSALGIVNVPGTVIQGCVQDVSSSSQQLFPDEGRATIGSLTFTAVDRSGELTDAMREQLLVFNRGARSREVRVFTGDGDDFHSYVRVDTYVIDNAIELDQGLYKFSCSDRNREQREEVFQQVGTRLTATLGTTDDVVHVQNTGGFLAVQHTAAFEDAPGPASNANSRYTGDGSHGNVGYIRVRKTGEIISWGGKTETSFTNCVRQCFRSIADIVVVNPSDAADKQPEIEEFIYLQMPEPQLKYAVMTGHILGTTDTLPDTWNLGIDEENVDTTAFENIGPDLYDPAHPENGFILNFPYLQQTDGKRFIEEQLNRVSLTFTPVDTLGRITVKRMASLISSASPVAEISYEEIISHDAIRHVQSAVINEIVMEWNYDGENYTRTDVLYNANSITTYGKGARMSLELGGVNASIHGRATLRHIMNCYTDRYGAPPIVTSARVSSAFNHLEIGDCVEVELPLLPDFTDAGTLKRVFEIQSRSVNWITGELNFGLFASTARVDPDQGNGLISHLPDAWFTSAGTPLSSVLTMVGDHVTAFGTLSGGTDLRTAVFYHDGDVIIDSGVTVYIDNNVQIRCTGELEIIGKIDGKGRGPAARADTNVVGTPYDFSWPGELVQTFGFTAAGSGLWLRAPGDVTSFIWGGAYQGIPAMTRFALTVEAGELLGLPSELRGTQGEFAPGVMQGGTLAQEGIVRLLGGQGGAGGAGLAIVSRGLSFGLAGKIDLSGTDGSTPPGPITLSGKQLYGGGGGGGAPGQLLVVMDGDQITFPDLIGTFVANRGATPHLGNPVDNAPPDAPDFPWCGHLGPAAADNARAASIVQYTTPDEALGDTQDELLAAPADLAAVGDGSGVSLSWKPPAADRYDYVEIWESIDNDRVNALRVAQVRGDHYSKTSGESITRYYWARSVRAGFGVSAWDPTAVHGGVEATFGGATGEGSILYYIKPTAGTAIKNSASTLTVEAHKLVGGTDVLLSSGTIKLYVGATEVTFANGYFTGSDGYTGVFDAGDIGGDVIVELKDGPAGEIFDTITLVDILDGAAADSATFGYVEASGPLAWTCASDQVTWTPSGTTVDLACTFRKGGADVARVARRITRDEFGFLTASSVAHPGGNLNTGRVTMTPLGSGTKSLTIKFDYVNGADLASTAEGVLSSLAGVDGNDGLAGSDSGGMIQNWSFEVGSLLPGWATSSSEATLLNDAGKAHTGTWCAHITTGAFGLRTAPTYRPSVIVGQTLVATCYAARDPASLPDTDGEFYIRWEDSSGTLIASTPINHADRTVIGYTGMRIEATVPVGATHAALCFSKSGGASGQWYVDDFTLTIKGDAGVDGPETEITANITRAGRTFTKTGGVDGQWDASFRSLQAYDSFSIKWRAGTTNKAMMVAANADPALDSSYTSLDFALFMNNDATLHIYESGAYIAALGRSYTTSTDFEITYDGQIVIFFVDGDAVWATPIHGARMYLDSSLSNTGAQITGLVFSPIGINYAIADEIRDDFGYKTEADFLRAWIDCNGGGEIAFIDGQGDVPGGTAIRIGNNSGNDQRWVAKDVLMPYDGVSLYEVGVIVRQNWGSGLFYCGVEGIAADGKTMLNTAGADAHGSQFYFAAADIVPPSGAMTVYRGYFKGWGTSLLGAAHNNSTSPGAIYAGSAFVRPMFLCNYSGATGQTDVAAIWLRRLGGALNAKDKADTPELVPAAATEVAVFYDADGVTYSNFS